jgi:hypothetical protein
MVLPFALPDWVPWWAVLLGIVVGLVVILAYLCMPFAVFGVKGRLATMEARLDEIQGEIRSLALRLPERHETEYDPYEEPPAERGRRPDTAPPQRRPVIVRPPIPPRAEDDEAPFVPARRRPEEREAPRPRTEPRFGPPR